jgi:hypothetical protein
MNNAFPPELRFTAEDAFDAFNEWLATCGPYSIAAACGVSLRKVRESLYDYHGWMNTGMVSDALRAMGQSFVLREDLKTEELCEGINRIQWGGEWSHESHGTGNPLVGAHYVAHRKGYVLCSVCAQAKWLPVPVWRKLLEEMERPFHVTHHYEIP